MNLGSRSKTYQFELISLTVIGQKTKKKIWQKLSFEFVLGQQLAVVNHIN